MGVRLSPEGWGWDFLKRGGQICKAGWKDLQVRSAK